MTTEPLRPPPPLAKRVAALVALVVLGVLAVALAGRIGEALEEQASLEAERVASAAAAGSAAEVSVVRPTASLAAPIVGLSGTLEPAQAADLAFEVPGSVARVEVTLGQAVRAGDVLVALDRASVGAQSAQSQAAIRVSEASAEMARDRVRLLEPLVQRGTMAERDLTTARQQLAIAEAQLTQARAGRRTIAASSADHVLRAPFAGIVTRVPSGVGVAATPGVPLVRVEDLSSLRLRTTVNRSELEVLRVGTEVILEGSEVRGTLATVVRSLDPETRRAPVEVTVSNSDASLVANSFVRGHVSVGEPRPALRIPSTCLRPDATVLVVAEGSRAIARPVVADLADGGGWDVFDGLDPDDRVVLRPAQVRDGQLIVPVDASAAPATAELSP